MPTFLSSKPSIQLFLKSGVIWIHNGLLHVFHWLLTFVRGLDMKVPFGIIRTMYRDLEFDSVKRHSPRYSLLPTFEFILIFIPLFCGQASYRQFLNLSQVDILIKCFPHSCARSIQTFNAFYYHYYLLFFYIWIQKRVM